MAIQIALVDENRYESLITACALENSGFNLVDVLNDWSQIEHLLTHKHPEAIVVSLESRAVHAVVLVEKARALNPDLGVVFLTSTPDLRLVGIAEKELPYGVQIILKSAVTDLFVLVDAIHRSIDDLKNRSKVRWVNGSTFMDESAFTSNLHTLTAVQIETLRLVALGSSNSEIARIRLVTEKAVEHTITRILQSLSIASNPRHNARVLLSREYHRWVNVSNEN